ncbi:MAG: PLP-dependent aminotransferase family protein [Gammaproteobacteria bacterium]|nr:PLP-dependent aminotransferase family protein [Gammaproteobacteria bacterium]
MALTLHVDRIGSQTRQGQIFDQIRRQILSGQLLPGTPVPATRELSEQLGVSRNTVVLAYERLIAEDYLQTRPGVGTFVNACLPEDSLMLRTAARGAATPAERLAPRHPVLFRGRAQAVVNPNRHQLAIDFWVGRPDPRSFPTKAWRRHLLHNLTVAGSNLTEYRNPAGIYGLRKAIADHLGPARGIHADPAQIIIVSGSQEALNVATRLLVREGTPVVTECPCYQGAFFVFESYGARIEPVPVDDCGIDVAQLPDARASLAYVTPSHQYPMGATLSLERRVRLLEWAWQMGAYVIEDDYDSDFRHHGSPLTALKGMDEHGSVIYVGTFSKSIGAGLRLGYMVVPHELVEPARTVKALLNNGQPWLDQAVLADFVASGSYARHLRRIRRTYLARRDCLIEALRRHFGDVSLAGVEGGMHLVWRLPAGFPAARELQALAHAAGIGVYALDSAAAHDFGREGYGRHTLMLGYSSLTEQQITEGIAQLAAALPAGLTRTASTRRARAVAPRYRPGMQTG